MEELIELDQKAVNSKRACMNIWAQEFGSDAEAIKAFMVQAAECTDYDYQLSQFIRRYMLKQHGVDARGV